MAREAAGVLPFSGTPGPGGTRSAAWPGPGGHRGGQAPCPLRSGMGFHLLAAFHGFGEAVLTFAARTRVAAVNFAPSFVPKRARSEELPGPGGVTEGAGRALGCVCTGGFGSGFGSGGSALGSVRGGSALGFCSGGSALGSTRGVLLWVLFG